MAHAFADLVAAGDLPEELVDALAKDRLLWDLAAVAPPRGAGTHAVALGGLNFRGQGTIAADPSAAVPSNLADISFAGVQAVAESLAELGPGGQAIAALATPMSPAPYQTDGNSRHGRDYSRRLMAAAMTPAPAAMAVPVRAPRPTDMDPLARPPGAVCATTLATATSTARRTAPTAPTTTTGTATVATVAVLTVTKAPVSPVYPSGKIAVVTGCGGWNQFKDNSFAASAPLILPITLTPILEIRNISRHSVQATVDANINPDRARVVYAQADNGADMNILPLTSLQGLGIKESELAPARNSDRGVRSIAGFTSAVGRVRLLVGFGNRLFVHDFAVFRDFDTILLDNDIWPALGLAVAGADSHSSSERVQDDVRDDTAHPYDIDEAPIIPQAEWPAEVAQLMKANGDIDPRSYCTHPLGIVRLDVAPGTKPSYAYPRRIDNVKHEAVQKQVAEWMQLDVIERCPHASPWNCVLVVVKKMDHKGEFTGWRICLDPRALNSCLPDDWHPIPQIFEYLDHAAGNHVVSALDIASAFHQPRVLDEHRDRVCFTWEGIQYRFKRGPFGLKALAGQFQRVVQSVLADLPYCRVYVDDVVVFSNSIEEHHEHLTEVLRRLNRYNLRVLLAKCALYRRSIAYLGHIITAGGILPAPNKVIELQDFPILTSGKQMMSFLGMVNFVQHLLPLSGDYYACFESSIQ